jgi:putative MFS transporter
MVIALGGVFVDAYDFTSLGIGTIQLRHELHLSAAAVGLLSATMAFSAMFGAPFGGYFVDKLGRKDMFLLDLWFFVVSAIGAALAQNLTTLILFRLLMGLGVGLDFPVALSFAVEFCDRARRGLFVNSSYVNWCLAALVGFAATHIGYVLGAGENLWRIAVGFGAVPALILLILRCRYIARAHHRPGPAGHGLCGAVLPDSDQGFGGRLGAGHAAGRQAARSRPTAAASGTCR